MVIRSPHALSGDPSAAYARALTVLRLRRELLDDPALDPRLAAGAAAHPAALTAALRLVPDRHQPRPPAYLAAGQPRRAASLSRS